MPETRASQEDDVQEPFDEIVQLREELKTSRELNDEMRQTIMRKDNEIRDAEKRLEDVKQSLGAVVQTLNNWQPPRDGDAAVAAVAIVRMFGKLEQLLHDTVSRL